MSKRVIVADDVTHNHSCSAHCDTFLTGSLQRYEDDGSADSCHSRGDLSGSLIPEAIIRGNMQFIDGQLKKIPRPLNAFMIFSNEKRKELKKEFPGEPNNMISSRLGSAWKALSEIERKRYHDMAHREDLEHRRKYPNYQYCPGHARKLKKARREQRMRQHGHFRHSKALQSSTSKNSAAEENRKSGYAGSSKTSQPSSAAVKVESRQKIDPSHPMLAHHAGRSSQSNATTSNLPGPHGEGPYPYPPHSYIPNSSELAPATECMMSCCAGCKPTDIYCCADPHWNPEICSGQGYQAMYSSQAMMYMSSGYDHQLSGELVSSSQCGIPGCTGCYTATPLMDSCYAAGDLPPDCAMPQYKEFCCIPASTQDMMSPHMSHSVTPATAVMSGSEPMECGGDTNTEFTDISYSLVPAQSSNLKIQASEANNTDQTESVSQEVTLKDEKK